MTSNKSVICLFVEGEYKKDKRYQFTVRHITRVVKNIKKTTRSTKGFPFVGFPAHRFLWADELTWTLYTGEIKYKNSIIPVRGWSYDNDPPKYWGGLFGYSEDYRMLDWVALWGWQTHSDIEVNGEKRRFSMTYQNAYHKIKTLLKEK